MLLFFLLLAAKTEVKVADIYDILSGSNGIKPRSAGGSQYVVGIYKEFPTHATTTGMNKVIMRSSFGTVFTCLVPTGDGERNEKMQYDAEEPESVDDMESFDEPLPSGVVSNVVEDDMTWFIRKFDTSCLEWNGGYWKTKVCFKPTAEITQVHGDVTFNLGVLDGVYDPLIEKHSLFTHLVAEINSRWKTPFLLLIFIGGSDGRMSLVTIGCANVYDRVKKVSEPAEMIYVIEVATKLACGRSNPKTSLNGLPRGVGETIDTAFDELTTGMQKVPCVYYTPGWFSFEICWKQKIKQFHVERVVQDGKDPVDTITDEYVLGVWDGEPITMVAESSTAASYAKSNWNEGTMCELTGRPRMTTVNLRCNKDSKGIQVESFQEIETCVYTFNVGMRSLCDHDEFKPQVVRTEEIVCYLSQAITDINSTHPAEVKEEVESYSDL